MLKYKAVSKLDGTEVSFDREAWAQAAVKEGWIDSFLPYEAPEPVPESPEEIRIREIDAELEKLDRDALRPMCTLSAWPQQSDVDYEKEMALMQAIEGMKIDLRLERRALVEDAEAVPAPADAEPVDTAAFLLNSTGSTYHLWECSLAKTGKKMTLAEIADKHPSAAPCATCCPPAFTKGS